MAQGGDPKGDGTGGPGYRIYGECNKPDYRRHFQGSLSMAHTGDPDTGATYYSHWLVTLERLVAEKGIATEQTLARYRDAWDRAADRTPHGTPIELRPDDFA